MQHRSPLERWTSFPSFAGGLFIAGALICGCTAFGQIAGEDPTTAAESAHPTLEEWIGEGMEWREVGPYRGGRCAAVAGIPDQPNVYYFGGTGGGVWKTTDAGVTWKNVSDGSFGGSIGAVAVSEWDPNVIYVGGGEKTVRGNVSHGDGVWRSTDAGRTWTSVGLTDTRHVARIRIHPRDPDLAYVAAMGHLFGPNQERGVYRTKDGGKNWEKILFTDEQAGCVDLVLDPTNPRIIYATFWRIIRQPWTLESGGEGSGIWKSTDGGDSWTELTENEGLPKGPIGISGISVSASNPDNLYAIIEAEEGGVFRSRDAGKTWTRSNEDRSLRQRAWYYTRIYADPADEEAVFVLNVQFHRSKDGGQSFSTISVPHGDNHDLWIDPKNSGRMIEGNDGGACITFDGGENWSRQDNQPTAQMYRVSVDDDFPYRLLGGQQDNSAIRIRSRSLQSSGIGLRDWDSTAGGESGHVVAKPGNPDLVYGGSYGGYLTVLNHRTGERRGVNVWPENPMGWGAAELRYRFQWNFPIFFSPHDPDLLYAAANVLFRSRDGGESWEPISPDLTRDDKEKQGPSGGPITKDNTSVEYYCTIFAAAESPIEPGVLWAGSDDGLVQLSRDGGERWSNVTPMALPEWAQINSIEVHPTLPGGLYVAATRYKLDDFHPYLYRTTDYGRTWTAITDGIDPSHFTRVIRADPSRPGLLYAGTERGVYVSFDDGGEWTPLQLKLPIVPITDLAVKDGDLVAATQGRGFWILDDLSTLHRFEAEMRTAAVHLFPPRPIVRLGAGRSDNPRQMGTNPHSGVVLRYHLGEKIAVETEVKLRILTEQGEEIRSFARKPEKDEEKKEEDDPPSPPSPLDPPKLLETKAGLNRFVWDLRYPGAESFPKMVLWNGGSEGPRAIPGTYRAELTVGEATETVSFTVLPDPRSSATPEDLRAQFDYLIGVRDQLSQVHREIARLRRTRGQLGGLKKRLGDEHEEIRTEIDSIETAMEEIEESLYQTKNKSGQDPLNFPIRLNDKLAGLLGLAGIGDESPTRQAHAVRGTLTTAINAELDRLSVIWSERLPALNRSVEEAKIDAIEVTTEGDGLP